MGIVTNNKRAAQADKDFDLSFMKGMKSKYSLIVRYYLAASLNVKVVLSINSDQIWDHLID